MTRTSLVALLACSTALIACPAKDSGDDGSSDTGGWSERELVSVDGGGVACLQDDGDDDTSSALVKVILSDCLSGCASDVSTGCEAIVVDGRIEVEAWGEYSMPVDDMAVCPAICIEMSAQCEVVGLDETVTEMVYDETITPIDYPASDDSCAPLDE